MALREVINTATLALCGVNTKKRLLEANQNAILFEDMYGYVKSIFSDDERKFIDIYTLVAVDLSLFRGDLVACPGVVGLNMWRGNGMLMDSYLDSYFQQDSLSGLVLNIKGEVDQGLLGHLDNIVSTFRQESQRVIISTPRIQSLQALDTVSFRESFELQQILSVSLLRDEVNGLRRKVRKVLDFVDHLSTTCPLDHEYIADMGRVLEQNGKKARFFGQAVAGDLPLDLAIKAMNYYPLFVSGVYVNEFRSFFGIRTGIGRILSRNRKEVF